MEQAKQTTITRQPQLNRQEVFKLLEELEKNDNITAKDFCERHHIKHSSFYYWMKRYRNRDADRSMSKSFVPLMVKTRPFLSSSGPACLFAEVNLLKSVLSPRK
jgi:hypothetical protein